MVVNESALLRAMREDYKGQGYTVARRAENEADPESESILLLSANDWMVEIGWKNVSAKIFGLVAEHMKGLPEVGQAFKVKKKETNTVIFDMVEKFPKHNPDAEQDADLTAAAKQYQGARAAFQSRDISTLPAAMAAAISAVAGPQEPPKPQTPKASEAGCLNNILAAMIK